MSEKITLGRSSLASGAVIVGKEFSERPEGSPGVTNSSLSACSCLSFSTESLCALGETPPPRSQANRRLVTLVEEDTGSGLPQLARVGLGAVRKHSAVFKRP